MALVIQEPEKATKISPNVLPCKISYNGPVNASPRYWDPQTGPNGSKVAYFRGRKLQGRTASIPAGYEGVVLQKTDRTILEVPPVESADMEEDEDDFDASEPPPLPKEIKVVENVASFDHITVWEHEAIPTESEDPYLRGVAEWMKMASAIHGRPNPAQSDP